MFEYEVGDTVVYRTWEGELRGGTVISKVSIKGEPGFDMKHSDGNTYWGYDRQIVQVARAFVPPLVVFG